MCPPGSYGGSRPEGEEYPLLQKPAMVIFFTADLDGDDVIRLEEDELAEAGWFSRDEIVEYPPYISVGHEMMKAFKDGTLFEDQECSKN
mgnify:CR=1 FL=1